MVIILILPVFYIAVSQPATQREYRYANAVGSQLTKSDAQQILDELAQNMNPSDLARLREELGGSGQLSAQLSPSNKPVNAYVQNLFALSDQIARTNDELNAANASLASRNLRQAKGEIKLAFQMIQEAQKFLKSMQIQLDAVHDQYGVDTTVQANKLSELGDLLQQSLLQINKLTTKLSAVGSAVMTFLSINITNRELLVDEPFLVYGFLRDQNGTALLKKNVIIAWGTNQTVVTQTEFFGRYVANLTFPVGYSPGATLIEASFEPQGNDSKTYLPSTGTVEVTVVYEPSKISGTIYPVMIHPSQSAKVIGNLTDSRDNPLPAKPLTIQLDGTSLGNATTNSIGGFAFAFMVPERIVNGTHNVTIAYLAKGDRFAPSNLTFPIVVEIVSSHLFMTSDRTWLLSGMRFSLNGTVTYENGTAATRENVTLYLDGSPYANVTIQNDGTFNSTVVPPFWLTFGSHQVEAVYQPSEPSVSGSQNLVKVYVYSTPILILTAAAIGLCPLGIYTARNRFRRPTVVAPTILSQPVVAEKPVLEDFSPEILTATLARERVNASKIRKSYQLAQAIIDLKVGVGPRTGETHWEYYGRVAKEAPQIRDSLMRLVEIFELAEYSPYPVEASHSKEAAETLLELREEIETVK